jgi:predicted ATPase with chaperone activity
MFFWIEYTKNTAQISFQEISGQAPIKHAFAMAAAGGHNMIM